MHQSLGKVQSRFTQSIFINESLGTLIIDESFLEEKIGYMEYHCIADKIEPCGIYITDYIADSILARNTRFNSTHTYKDILGGISYSSFNRSITYINGVIKTNYREKYKELIDYTLKEKNIDLNEIHNYPIFDSFLKEIYSYLGFTYSFNKNFVVDMEKNTPANFAWTHRVVFDDNKDLLYTTGVYVFKDDGKYELTGNEVMMNYEKYNEIFNTNYTSSDFQSFTPHKMKIKTYLFSDVNMENLLVEEELTIKGLIKDNWMFEVSDELLSKFSKHSLQIYGLYFNGLENIDEVIDISERLGYTQRIFIVEAIHTMTKAVDVFIPIFELVAIFLCIGIIFILVSFSTKMIKDKMHDIGILKAIGTQSKTIGRIFGLQIILIAILTILMSTFGYYYFIDMANDVLIASLKELAASHIVLDLDFLTFKLSVVNINVILILFLSILSLFIPMLKIRKIKPVKIIKTKE